MRIKKGLTLAEKTVLALICERPRHGYSLGRIVAADGEVGRIWTIRQALAYRALEPLAEDGLIEVARETRDGNRRRVEYRATEAGKRVNREWLSRPEQAIRDIRSSFLLKLTFLNRSGQSTAELLDLQEAAIQARIAELDEDPEQSDLDLVQLWRRINTEAALKYVQALKERDEPHLAEVL